jgi:hypothetical protein
MDDRQQDPETPYGDDKSRKDKVLEKFGMHVPHGKEDQLHLQPRFFKFLGFLGILRTFAQAATS